MNKLLKRVNNGRHTEMAGCPLGENSMEGGQMRYTDLITEALKSNRGKIETLQSCEPFVNKLIALGERWEEEYSIDSVCFIWPEYNNDYSLASITLEEKGSITADVNFILDDLEALGFAISGDKNVSPNSQTFAWWLKFTHTSHEGAHPRLRLKVDATKSTKCVQVDTGRTQPVYEMKCVDE